MASASASLARAAERRLRERTDPAVLSWLALAAMLLAVGGFLLYELRGTTLWFDEWLWALGRRGGGVASVLDAYNGHLSLVPVAIYKLLFATAGLSDDVPYRLMIVVGHLAVVLLVFVYARPRVGRFPALIAAALILFLGPGWQNIMWPFQIAWLIAVGAGIAALLALERRSRTWDVCACLLLTVSVASTSVGVAVLVGAAVEVLWRRPRRDWWIVAIPAALYAVWALAYQHTGISEQSVTGAPDFVATGVAGALAGLFGLGGAAAPGPGTLMTWGPPLAAVALAALAWRARDLQRIPVRAVVFLTMLGVFLALAAVARSDVGNGYDSRYLYASGVFIVLAAVELAAGLSVRLVPALAIAAVTGFAALSNVGEFRAAGSYLRAAAPLARGDLAALDLLRGTVPAGYVASHFPGYPLIVVHAGAYYATDRAIGSPAYTVPELLRAPEPARVTADGELIAAHHVGLEPISGAAPTGAAPAVDGSFGGTATTGRSCVTFTAGLAGTPAYDEVQVTVPQSGAVVRTANAPAQLSLRRFSRTFASVAALPAQAAGALRIATDHTSVPWHLQVATTGRATICGLT